MADPRLETIRRLIRDVPDFPKPGILFKDITPMLADGRALGYAIDLLAETLGAAKPTAIVGIESRGFLFGAPLAKQLGVGFVPVRKPGKLPYKCRSVSYALEYGTDRLEIHEDALGAADRVFILDDLLATGGTMAATCELVEHSGAKVLGCRFLIELGFLAGRTRLKGHDCRALLVYP
jgi:adenine phosphoribosyltransferase